jgi:hypothetical protein
MFVPYGTHPNFAFGKTSFMLETLSNILLGGFLGRIDFNSFEDI